MEKTVEFYNDVIQYFKLNYLKSWICPFICSCGVFDS
jgi:hypothetical protein